MAAFDNGNYTRLYEEGEQHEIGSVLMPETLANALAYGYVPFAPAFGHPGTRYTYQRKPDGSQVIERCAVIDDEPVSDEWQKRNAQTLDRILGNDKQLHSYNYPTGDYPVS